MRSSLVVLLALVVAAPCAYAQTPTEPVPPVLLPIPFDDPACNVCAEPPRPAYASPQYGAYPPGMYLKRRPNAAVWVPGLIVWIGSYIGSAAGGISRDGNYWAAIPFFGAIGSGIAEGLFGSGGAAVGYMLGGIGQIGGLVTFAVGMAGTKKWEKMPIQLGPTAYRDGGGMNLTLKF